MERSAVSGSVGSIWWLTMPWVVQASAFESSMSSECLTAATASGTSRSFATSGNLKPRWNARAYVFASTFQAGANDESRRIASLSALRASTAPSRVRRS
jgi:hypothetical protein